MSHQPPVPAGNQSPYPLHEAPHKHDDAPPAGAAVAKTPERKRDSLTANLPTLSNGVIGALAAVGLTALAAAGAWAFTHRSDTGKRKNKNKTRKRAKR
jgi:hypothetical protein